MQTDNVDNRIQLETAIPVPTDANNKLQLESKARMTTDMVLIIIAIAVPVVSWVYIPFGGDSHWFGRSGTIMAIIGIVLESRLFTSKLIINELAHIPREHKGGISYRYVMSKAKATLSHFILIAGALISGYGDLMFAEIKLGI